MIDDFAIEAFARDGVVVVRGLVPGELIADLRNGSVPANQTGSDAADFFSYDDLVRIEAQPVLDLALSSRVSEFAASLVDSNTSILHHCSVLANGADSQTKADSDLDITDEDIRLTPKWVQDQSQTNIKGRAITALVSTASERTMSPQFWAGSHMGPLPLREKQETSTTLSSPEIEFDPSRYDIRQWRLEAGDVLFYNSMVVRSAGHAIDSGKTKEFTVTYVAPDAKVVEREWPTTPTFGNELQPGSKFEGNAFPVAWSQSASLNSC